VREAVLRGLQRDPAARWPSMPELLRALHGATRRPAWAAAAVVAGLVLAAAAAGTAWMLADREDAGALLCTGAEAKLAAVWGPPQRQAVEQAFLATGLPYAAQTWSRVGPRLDDHAEGWRAAFGAACEAAPEGARQLDRRMACLERHRDALAAQVEVFAAADAAVVEQAVVAINGLRPADACLRADPGERSPPEDPALARRYDELSRELARAEALARSGGYRAALPLAEQAAAEARALPDLALEGRALLVLGGVQDALGELDEAEDGLERAYFIGRQLADDELARTAADRLVLVAGAQRQDYERGLEWARHAEAELELRDDALARGEHLGNLGLLLTLRGDYDQALRTLQQALEIHRAVLPPGDLAIADQLGRIGIVLRKLDDDAQAAAYHEQALAIYEQALGPDHPEVARVLHNLAAAQFRSGSAERAVASTRRAVAIWEAALGRDHVTIATALVNLSVMLVALDRHEQAEQAARDAIERLERSGTQPHTLCAALVALANAQHGRGRYEDAASTHRRAVAAFEQIGLDDHPDLAQELVNFGDTLERLHELQQAEAVLRRALAIFERSPDPPLRHLHAIHELLAHVALGREQWAQAVEHAERRIALEPVPVAQPYRVASMYLLLARARWGLGRDARERALADAEQAERVAAELPPGEREDRLRREIGAWRAEHEPGRR
jgi:tetratricopeptide (TPR) repeat protein